MRTIVCHKCNHSWAYENIIGRTEECPKCRWDVHVCLNCTHYDKSAARQCREPDADFVKEKDESNFCDLFEAKGAGKSGNSEEDKAKSALDSLFGAKKSEPTAEEKAKASIEDELKKFLNKR